MKPKKRKRGEPFLTPIFQVGSAFQLKKIMEEGRVQKKKTIPVGPYEFEWDKKRDGWKILQEGKEIDFWRSGPAPKIIHEDIDYLMKVPPQQLPPMGYKEFVNHLIRTAGKMIGIPERFLKNEK